MNVSQSYESYTTDPSADEFAQTRAPDDLFDDDFTPLADPVVEAPRPVPETIPIHEPIQTQHVAPRDVTRDAARAPRSRGPPRKAPVPQARASPPADREAEAKEDVPAQPKPERKEGAVRGDRSATGGPKQVCLWNGECFSTLDTHQPNL
jgi:hypothetical protein